MTKDYYIAKKIFYNVWKEKSRLNWSGDTSMINSSSLFRELFFPSMDEYFNEKSCKKCKYYIKQREFCSVHLKYLGDDFSCNKHVFVEVLTK